MEKKINLNDVQSSWLRTCMVLKQADYHQINTCDGPKDSRLTFWAGRRGLLIVQTFHKTNTVLTFADWPLGSTFEKLIASL